MKAKDFKYKGHRNSYTAFGQLSLSTPATETATDRQHNVWLRDPLAIKIFNLEMLVQKLDYMHLNPLQPHWLLCNHPAEYRFSSAIFYEQQVDEFGILTNFSEVF